MDLNCYKDELEQLNIGDLIENEPMYKHTTFKVGGPARFFIQVKDLDSLKRGIAFLNKYKIPYMVIGRGSDLLFSDKEYEGVVLCLNTYFNQYSINGVFVKAQAGVSMIQLSYDAAKTGLSGFEFMGGIPGSIGGGLFMNAGAYKYCFADVFYEATILNENNEIIVLNKEQMNFGYRHSILQEHKEWILIDATFKMNPGDPIEIRKILDKRKERRMSTQPWNFPSAGSVFRNPEEKPAWQCVDECGLRGYEIGGAQISPKHSNFVVNNGYASAKDILALIELVQKTVYEKLGIELHKEIILVNW